MDYARGQYTIIEQPFKCGENVWIGNFVHLRPGAILGDNIELRDCVWFGPNVCLGNNIRIMNKTIIASETIIHDDVFIGPGVMTANAKDFTTKKLLPIVIEENVKIGVGAIILPNVILRRGCVIGAGAVVTKSTESNGMYIGVPARRMKLPPIK